MPNNKRIELQDILEGVLESTNVYFQPPESKKLEYPCIVYALNDIRPNYADNQQYRRLKSYKVTAIDFNPDSEIPDRLGKLDYCSFNTYYAADNLNHYVFTLYF